MWILSSFTIFENIHEGVLAKNTFTEAVMFLDHETKQTLDHWIPDQQTALPPSGLNELIEHEFLIDKSVDEFAE